MKQGERIEVINGQHNGRPGSFIKNCSAAFNDWCRVELDLKGRERNAKIIMILKKDIQPM